MNVMTTGLENSTILLPEIEDFIGKAGFDKVLVLVDENSKSHCLPILTESLGTTSLQLIEVKSGEANKTLSSAEFIWQKLFDAMATRNSLLLNLGGGMITDLGGWAAANYKRGMNFIHIPTTLLAMVDAAWGGKTGVNHQHIKNSIGSFARPAGLVIEPRFLHTLPHRQLLNGWAEMLKHALVADFNQWNEMKGLTPTVDNINPFIQPSYSIKNAIVENDPLEKGQRKLLNFGHTVGHALESYFMEETQETVFHGEAVAAGMIIESYISTKRCGLSESELHDITGSLTAYFPRLNYPPGISGHLIKTMHQDKKKTTASLNFTLLEKTGKGIINQTASEETVKRALAFYQSLS